MDMPNPQKPEHLPVFRVLFGVAGMFAGGPVLALAFAYAGHRLDKVMHR